MSFYNFKNDIFFRKCYFSKKERRLRQAGPHLQKIKATTQEQEHEKEQEQKKKKKKEKKRTRKETKKNTKKK